MHDIQNTCVFIYFPISFFVITWSGGWMTKALDCGQRGEGSKLTLDMTLAWWSIASFNKLSIVSLKMKLGIRVMDLMRVCFGFVHNSIHKNIENLKDIIIIVKCTYTIIIWFFLIKLILPCHLVILVIWVILNNHIN
jgi:hypothetical protein